MRVGIVGARIARQGTGPWMARAFRDAGCEVAAIVGTRPETVEAAQAGLRERFGIEARGFTRVEDMLSEARIDILVVCSPTGTHRPSLEAALGAGVHVLCEKPLWWGADELEVDRSAEVEALAQGFDARGLCLALNAQWPWTLGAYDELVGAGAERPTRAEMRLSPIARGPIMVVDSAPHLLSLLIARLGLGEVAHPRCARHPEWEDARLNFAWRTPAGDCEVELVLERCEAPPRPAGYGFDGRLAMRRVELPSYQQFLTWRGREVRLVDPLQARVKDYVAGLEAGAGTDVAALVTQHRGLRALTHAASIASERPPGGKGR